MKCPGCYAYDAAHLGGEQTLRDLNDRRGQSLVDGVLEVVDRLKPLHLSIVGGDPLVRYRELELMIAPLLAFHRTFDDLVGMLPKTLPFVQIGINQAWKKEIKVLRRKGTLS